MTEQTSVQRSITGNMNKMENQEGQVASVPTDSGWKEMASTVPPLVMNDKCGSFVGNLGVEEQEKLDESNAPHYEKVLPKNDDTTQTNVEREIPSMARKAGVALMGGALVAAGIPLIPLPGPGDFMVLGGMVLLASEFPIAQKALDRTRQGLVSVLDEEKGDDNRPKGEVESVEEDQDKVDIDDLDISAEAFLKEMKQTTKQCKQIIGEQAKRLGRNGILPLLDKVCTPGETNTDRMDPPPTD